MNRFLENLRLLQQGDPELALRVMGDLQDAQIALQATTAGHPTLVVQTPKQAYALHHPSDPVGQSRSFLESIPQRFKARNLAVIGGGLGYTPLLIYQTQSKLQTLFVLEPSLSVFRAALRVNDLTPLLSDRRVHFIVGSEPGMVYAALMRTVVDLVANPLMTLEIPSITAAFPQWAQSVKQQIAEVMQFGQSGIFSKCQDGPRTLVNLFQNLEAIVNTPGLIQVGKSFQNIPAIIVAAGPSLKKNIDRLKEVGDEFLLIATDTAFEPLLKRGILPHFVVTVDPTELNLKHFPRDRYSEETILLFDPEARPEIVHKFPRRMTFMTDKHPFFTWLDRETGGKGIMPKGNMVSQAGMYAAHFLGCDPLIVVGQDLALDPETGHTHNSETAYCRTAYFLNDDRHHADITVPVGDSTTTRENLFWVEGIDGKPVPTVQNFLVYLRMLEKDIRTLNLHLIDATEGGAKIQGSQILSLAETIRQHRRSGFNARTCLPSIQSENHSTPTLQVQKLKDSLRKILIARLTDAREGMNQWEKSKNLNRSVLDRMIVSYRERLFANPVAEYLIENGAPRELFEFMRLGPATLTDEEERSWTEKRLHILLQSVSQAAERLMKYL